MNWQRASEIADNKREKIEQILASGIHPETGDDLTDEDIDLLNAVFDSAFDDVYYHDSN